MLYLFSAWCSSVPSASCSHPSSRLYLARSHFLQKCYISYPSFLSSPGLWRDTDIFTVKALMAVTLLKWSNLPLQIMEQPRFSLPFPHCPFFFLRPHHLAYGMFVLRPGIELTPPALGVQSLNHWTTREVLPFLYPRDSWYMPVLGSCIVLKLHTCLFQVNSLKVGTGSIH